jgi:hypothetical protein
MPLYAGAASSSKVLIEKVDFSGDSYVDFEFDLGKYENYEIELRNIVSLYSQTAMSITLTQDGTNFLTSNDYDSHESNRISETLSNGYYWRQNYSYFRCGSLTGKLDFAGGVSGIISINNVSGGAIGDYVNLSNVSTAEDEGFSSSAFDGTTHETSCSSNGRYKRVAAGSIVGARLKFTYLGMRSGSAVLWGIKSE